MNDLANDHREHTIFCHASGFSNGPFVASFSAWRIEPNNSYRAVTQGTLPSVFDTREAAFAAALAEAKLCIDKLLG